MADGRGFEPIKVVFEISPVVECEAGILGAGACAVPALQKKVVEEEGDVKAGVAKVDDFVIDGKESGSGVDEEVFWGPVSVGEGLKLSAGLLDGPIEIGLEIGVARGGEAVVGVETELVEEVEAGEVVIEIVGLQEDRVDLCSLDSEGRFRDACEKTFFPGGGIGGGSRHRKEEVVAIFKEDSREAVFRS